MTSATLQPPERKGLLDRVLAPFAEVRTGEAGTALLLMLNVFLLLTSYYIIKTVREPLILAGGGAEVKSYAAAGQALLLLVLVPAYGAFASRVNRLRLISWVTVFFISNLVIFYLLAQVNMPFLGVAFFLWVGIFNLMIVAQFWSFANDLYTPEQGKRLFAIVAFGSSLGAILGAWVAKQLIKPVGVYQLMLVAAGILALCILITWVVHARETAAKSRRIIAAPGAAAVAEAPLGKEGGFQLVFSQRYLLLIALLMMVLNFVNTNGEYILGKVVTGTARDLVAQGQAGSMDPDAWTKQYIGLFYADFFGWVNLLSALMQLFLASRMLKWFGVRGALFMLPVIALGGYGLLVAAPILSMVRIAKILENSTDYSIQNTSRQALFLPTSREAKYKAKAAIDSFFVRGGDLLSTGLVFLGTQLALGPRNFAAINLGLVLVWLVIVAMIGREHKRLTGDAERAPRTMPETAKATA
jgi:AAA family ATP:ADP antiporter